MNFVQGESGRGLSIAREHICFPCSDPIVDESHHILQNKIEKHTNMVSGYSFGLFPIILQVPIDIRPYHPVLKKNSISSQLRFVTTVYLDIIVAIIASTSKSFNFLKGLGISSNSTIGFSVPSILTTKAPLRGFSELILTAYPASLRAFSIFEARVLNAPL